MDFDMKLDLSNLVTTLKQLFVIVTAATALASK
jgi:hypothetical protein